MRLDLCINQPYNICKFYLFNSMIYTFIKMTCFFKVVLAVMLKIGDRKSLSFTPPALSFIEFY